VPQSLPFLVWVVEYTNQTPFFFSFPFEHERQKKKQEEEMVREGREKEESKGRKKSARRHFLQLDGHQLQYIFQTHYLFDDIRLYSTPLFSFAPSLLEMKRLQEPSLVDREERKNISDEFSQMF
jgi:hypothetical protein